MYSLINVALPSLPKNCPNGRACCVVAVKTINTSGKETVVLLPPGRNDD